MIGLVAAVLAIGEPARQALLAPDISVDPAVNSLLPFAFPFIVKNESWLFSMDRTNLNCGIDEVKFRDGQRIGTVTIKDAKRATIKPRESALFRCSIATINMPELVKGHVLISVDYNILWGIPRHSPETDFTWLPDGNPPHWAKGISSVFTP